jgi:hypothetical protein
MTSKDEAPIACTLDGGDYQARLAWIAQLNRDGLRSHRLDVMTLELHYDAAVRDRVHQLVRQETECCAFLTFAIDESAEQVIVTITVPERASEVAGDLFAAFLPADHRPAVADGDHVEMADNPRRGLAR